MKPAEEQPSRRGALGALIVIVLLVVGAVLLVRGLHRTAAVQDCLMAGRRDCVPIEAGSR